MLVIDMTYRYLQLVPQHVPTPRVDLDGRSCGLSYSSDRFAFLPDQASLPQLLFHMFPVVLTENGKYPKNVCCLRIIWGRLIKHWILGPQKIFRQTMTMTSPYVSKMSMFSWPWGKHV